MLLNIFRDHVHLLASKVDSWDPSEETESESWSLSKCPVKSLTLSKPVNGPSE